MLDVYDTPANEALQFKVPVSEIHKLTIERLTLDIFSYSGCRRFQAELDYQIEELSSHGTTLEELWYASYPYG